MNLKCSFDLKAPSCSNMFFFKTQPFLKTNFNISPKNRCLEDDSFPLNKNHGFFRGFQGVVPVLPSFIGSLDRTEASSFGSECGTSRCCSYEEGIGLVKIPWLWWLVVVCFLSVCFFSFLNRVFKETCLIPMVFSVTCFVVFHVFFFSHFRKRIGDVDLAAHVCPGLGGGGCCASE